ncbi:carbamoyl-phosphate synthase large subunit [Acetobacterium paludosum]|uniref:Carbamoyl phosphate synthase large chain n=1 Tax=Acetobacterium paludosum TaxID=52693 RepID=A0A923KXE7_9FIRM|nr:carbamoyl-phosphate synthase large subunit [Acetobacterium paludosum]MBC3889248.1 carbamoyl-phosphate synthase large subunit [Acetobacterium paludosum]
MPLRSDIKRVLVIGSGPIIIGQAAEFDYAGTQACKALKKLGLEVILVNSNPATIMTDKIMADKVYIEPLTLTVIRRIILMEKPDSILSTIGGQTGLTLSMQLAKEGFLEAHDVKLLGANLETIEKAEDRQAFKDMMQEIGEPCIPSEVVTTVEAAVTFALNMGYPVIVRPAFTLGGTGGGIVNNQKELEEVATNGLRLSPITQILVEKGIAGWKEIEFEVMRDAKGNVITVCSMENLDPVGIHTGDSIVVAPCQTLSDKEFQMLRTSALKIISALKVEGGCNCQFALNPQNFNYAVIEVNPRVSRSSALASKATGYPIAKVASQIAVGFSLDEIINEVTGTTTACFEPALDYIVVKFPRWPFDKFVYAKRTLGTQMKATGEIMAIGSSFEHAMMKAIRSIELGFETLSIDKLVQSTDAEIMAMLGDSDDERCFVVYEAIKRGVSLDTIFDITKIDKWFLDKLRHLAIMEKDLATKGLTEERVCVAREIGFLDKTIEALSGAPIQEATKTYASFKMVDTCAGEFAAQTPYFYSTRDKENEAALFIEEHPSDKKRILVLGSGPIRIGQGIEFDYCSVHCSWALREMGYESILINNNPETVSTDYDTSDRLYFEPLTQEDVRSVVETEKPIGAIVQFGGQTAIKLTRYLEKMGVPVLGTSPANVDAAEDREVFDQLLEKCQIPRPQGETVFTTEDGVEVANRLGFPVLLRPSYVLGGQNMIIAYEEEDVVEYMNIITTHELENPVLIDKYLMGKEVEVDAISDGENYLIPGIMEHIERAGVHSGDSISVYPPQTLDEETKQTIVDYTGRLVKALDIIGMVNIQYVIYKGKVYVIEVNPRSSRTVPYISKVTDIPMVNLATKMMLGEKLVDLGYTPGLYPEGDYVAVKVPVFSFAKLQDVDTQLGPEMKSTGEVLGVAKTFADALYKGLVASGSKMERSGGVILTVKDRDKEPIIAIGRQFHEMGFTIYGTVGTALILNENNIPTKVVRRMSESEPNIGTLLESGKINYVISTSTKGRMPLNDSVRMRRKSVESSISLLTSLDTAQALLDCLKSNRTMEKIDLVNIKDIR